MIYDESTKSYQYVRIDGSLVSLKDPFPEITDTYRNENSEWSPEDKISWDEIAPSLQELILKSRIIEWDELDDDIQNKLHQIELIRSTLDTEASERKNAVVLLQGQLDKLSNLELRMLKNEKEIANLWIPIDDLQNIIEGFTHEIDFIKERIEVLQDRIEQIERQIDLLWKEIFFIWGGELKDWLRYRNKKWDIPRIWFDIWYIWSRDTTYSVYREDNEDFDDETNQESEYEADYLRHKTHMNTQIKSSWNIPHIWDELWWLWGGITEIGQSNTALAQAAEIDNEEVFGVWRNHTSTIYLETDKSNSETKIHNLNIPNIWRDLWWTWNADPDYLVESVASSDTTKDYPLTNIDKWSTADTNREEDHNIWRNWVNPATNRYLTIPNVWRDVWYLWGGTNQITSGSSDSDLLNQTYYRDWRNHTSTIYLETDKSNSETKIHNLNIPNIWRDLWWTWNEDPDQLVDNNELTDVKSNSDKLLTQTDIAREADYMKWRNHINKSNQKYITIPNLLKDFWYVWSQAPNSYTENDEYENEYKLWKTFSIGTITHTMDISESSNVTANTSCPYGGTCYMVGAEIQPNDQCPYYGNGCCCHDIATHTYSIYPTLPNLLKFIWHIWSDKDTDKIFTDAADMKQVNDDFLENSSKAWNIPHIWEELYFLWGGFEEDWINNKKQEWDIPHIWAAIKDLQDALQGLDELWQEIYFLWGGDQGAFNTNKKQEWDIPHIWEKMSNLGQMIDEIYFLWGGDQGAFNTNKKQEWDIPHIWEKMSNLGQMMDEIYFLWGGTESDYNQNKAKAWDIPHIWTSLDTKVSTSVYTSEIDRIWAAINNGSYVPLSTYNAEVERIWAAINSKVSIDTYNTAMEGKVDAVAYTTAVSGKLDTETFNREGTKLWAGIGNKVDNDTYTAGLGTKLDTEEFNTQKTAIVAAVESRVPQQTYDDEIARIWLAVNAKADTVALTQEYKDYSGEIVKIWSSINEIKSLISGFSSKIDGFNGVIDVMRETWSGHSSNGNINVSTNVSGGGGCGGGCGSSGGSCSGSLSDSSKLLGAIKDLAGYPSEDNEGDNSAMEIIYNDEQTADEMPIYGNVPDDGNSGNCYGSSDITNFGHSTATGAGDYAWYVKSPNGNGANLTTDELPYYLIGTVYKSHPASSSTSFNIGNLYIYQSGCIFFKFNMFNNVTADDNYHLFQIPLPFMAWPGKEVKTVGYATTYVAINSNIDALIEQYGENTSTYWYRIANCARPVKNGSAFACRFNVNGNAGDNLIHIAKDSSGNDAFPYVKGLVQIHMSQTNFNKGYFGVFYSYGFFSNGNPKLTVNVNTTSVGQYPKSTDDFWSWFKFNHRYYPITNGIEAEEPITPKLFGTTYSEVVQVFKTGTGDDGRPLLGYI